jgi:phosphoribosyl 1,2-cyclic phosphate phosphodiesterase
MQLVFLGSGDERGVPRIGCDCDVCRHALSQGNRSYRTGPSVVLRYGPSYAGRTVLIDAAPEFRLQATSLGLQQCDAVLLTHAHDAHILGLSTLASAQREAGHPLAIHAPAQVLDDVRERFEFLWTDKTYRRVWQPRAIEERVDLWDLVARPVRVNHGTGGTAYGYLLAYGDQKIAYVPDVLRASADVRHALLDLDLLVLGSKHYYESREMWKRSVMDIMTALELIREVVPKRSILTHLSHTVDYGEITAKLPPGVHLAYDGLVVEVGT